MQIELSLAIGYVPRWTYIEAVRELFQNAIDQETIDPENEYFYEYSHSDCILKIGNKKSVLDKSMLLLGKTTKADNEDLIGQYGEGMKLAMLVLTRENLKVTIHNFGNDETWTPFISHSKKYGVDVLTVDIDKYYFTSPPDNNLTIIVEGITKEMWGEIQKFNLHSLPTGYKNMNDIIRTEKGNVLLNERYQKCVFVNGLFVSKCKIDKMGFGYDIPAKYINLDRDRKLIQDFDLFFQTSEIWLNVPKEFTDYAARLIKKDAPDVQYIKYKSGEQRTKEIIFNSAHDDFTEEYGSNAVPVTNQKEMEHVQVYQPSYRPVIVSESRSHAVRSSDYFKAEVVNKPVKSPTFILSELLDSKGDLRKGSNKRFLEIVEESRKWAWK